MSGMGCIRLDSRLARVLCCGGKEGLEDGGAQEATVWVCGARVHGLQTVQDCTSVFLSCVCLYAYPVCMCVYVWASALEACTPDRP